MFISTSSTNPVSKFQAKKTGKILHNIFTNRKQVSSEVYNKKSRHKVLFLYYIKSVIDYKIFVTTDAS